MAQRGNAWCFGGFYQQPMKVKNRASYVKAWVIGHWINWSLLLYFQPCSSRHWTEGDHDKKVVVVQESLHCSSTRFLHLPFTDYIVAGYCFSNILDHPLLSMWKQFDHPGKSLESANHQKKHKLSLVLGPLQNRHGLGVYTVPSQEWNNTVTLS